MSFKIRSLRTLAEESEVKGRTGDKNAGARLPHSSPLSPHEDRRFGAKKTTAQTKVRCHTWRRKLASYGPHTPAATAHSLLDNTWGPMKNCHQLDRRIETYLKETVHLHRQPSFPLRRQHDGHILETSLVVRRG